MSDLRGARFSNLFASPMIVHVWEDGAALNAELTERILEHRQANPGARKTNIGGWHSDSGQLEFCGAAGRTLTRHMYELADEATRRVLTEFGQPMRPMRWTLHAWANVNEEGDFNRVHTHPGSTWSGTYYVDPGDPPADQAQGTPIAFFDPCQGRANTFLHPQVPNFITLRPEPGLMVLFPSYLPHMVYAHHGGRPRISIAFNLRREPFP
ncbi:MAG TPA: TIGR02466 family protein [Acetobacteraceae bacterium]|nr:TIGR02466 family protein [Acetobacteraceae bacterium]